MAPAARTQRIRGHVFEAVFRRPQEVSSGHERVLSVAPSMSSNDDALDTLRLIITHGVGRGHCFLVAGLLQPPIPTSPVPVLPRVLRAGFVRLRANQQQSNK